MARDQGRHHDPVAALTHDILPRFVVSEHDCRNDTALACRRDRTRGSNLYAYDIASGTVALVGAVGPAVYAGSDLRDSRGNIYFGRFGDGTSFDGKARLAVLHP